MIKGTEIELRFERGQIHVTNVVTLEQYLRGVVPAEMPALYPRAAVEAQCVASRTYALFALRQAARSGRAPPVFAATQGFQVYRGVEIEHARVRLEHRRADVAVVCHLRLRTEA